MSDLSLSDVAAVTGNENGFGGSNAWAMIILFALIFGGNGFGGFGNRGNVATTADVQRATDFQALERQNNEGVAATRQAAYDVTSAVKDGNYNLLGEVRTLENNVNTGFASVQNGMASGFAGLQNAHTEILRAIDSAKYDNAMNTQSINNNTTAQIQKVLDTVTGNRMADMQQQINNLQMQNAMAGVVRYPNGWTYNAGTSPFCGCGCGNMG